MQLRLVAIMHGPMQYRACWVTIIIKSATMFSEKTSSRKDDQLTYFAHKILPDFVEKIYNWKHQDAEEK